MFSLHHVTAGKAGRHPACTVAPFVPAFTVQVQHISYLLYFPATPVQTNLGSLYLLKQKSLMPVLLRWKWEVGRFVYKWSQKAMNASWIMHSPGNQAWSYFRSSPTCIALQIKTRHHSNRKQHPTWTVSNTPPLVHNTLINHSLLNRQAVVSAVLQLYPRSASKHPSEREIQNVPPSSHVPCQDTRVL